MKQFSLVGQFIRTGIKTVVVGLAVGWLLSPAALAVDTGASQDATRAGERKIKYYQSTMNPGEVKPGPGKDTMGMEMVPVYENDDSSASAIQIDAATIQRMNLKTAPVERGPLRREIRAVGIVAYNEEGLRDITTKYGGWIEKLIVNTTWTTVRAGDALFEIYSPDLYNAQLNYLVARESESGPTGPLTRAALARLELFDVSEKFIDEVVSAGEPKRTYLYRAATAGVVIEKMAVEGQMVAPGERIFRLADLSSVWALAQIYESDLPFVTEAQPVTVRATYGSARAFSGKIDLLLPRVEEQTRTVTARLVLQNPDGFLRPGMFVDVRFATQLADSAVLVPDSAVLRSGDRNSVFVALDGGSFEPRNVTLGVRSEGNFYEVKDGLSAGECVVTSGQFMLDSESQLREAIQKMLTGKSNGPAAGGHEDHGAMANSAAAQAAGHSGRAIDESLGATRASATESAGSSLRYAACRPRSYEPVPESVSSDHAQSEH